jgi:hypothetical protein
MILKQNLETGFWTDTDNPRIKLHHVHGAAQCESLGCAIHNHPSNHRLSEADLNWRDDRGILERICEHGVGHPDRDAALYLESIGAGYENIHGCDGCCGGVLSV